MAIQVGIVFSNENRTSNNTTHPPIFCSGERISGQMVVCVDGNGGASFDAAEIVFKGD
jgi:hypothetical protein